MKTFRSDQNARQKKILILKFEDSTRSRFDLSRARPNSNKFENLENREKWRINGKIYSWKKMKIRNRQKIWKLFWLICAGNASYFLNWAIFDLNPWGLRGQLVVRFRFAHNDWVQLCFKNCKKSINAKLRYALLASPYENSSDQLIGHFMREG